MARRGKEEPTPDDGPLLPAGLIEPLAKGGKRPAELLASYRQFQKALTERVLPAELTQRLGSTGTNELLGFYVAQAEGAAFSYRVFSARQHRRSRTS